MSRAILHYLPFPQNPILPQKHNEHRAAKPLSFKNQILKCKITNQSSKINLKNKKNYANNKKI
jgi:hypothetical protein